MQKQYTKNKSKSQHEMPEEWQTISDGVTSPLIKKLTYYKWRNVKISACLRSIGERSRADMINECGTYAVTSVRNGHDVFKYANFCRQRMCQVCAWRRSSKFVAQMIPVCNALSAQGYKFIFITLSLRNCASDDVAADVSRLLEAWDRMSRRAKYKRAIKGYCRSLEVTYNVEREDYHPHLHILAAVDNDYFTSKKYISHDVMLEDWKAAARVDYLPDVHIEKCYRGAKKNKDTSSTAAAIETIKYAYKISSKHIKNETIATIFYSLANRRLVSFGGVIEELRKQLQQSDIDDPTPDTEAAAVDTSQALDCIYIFNPNGWRIIDPYNEAL